MTNPRPERAPQLIPYITLRSGEHDQSGQSLVLSPYRAGVRIAYSDEVPEDRDDHGLLYARTSQRLDAAGWPTGQPEREDVHPARQRECMGEFVCHVCRRDVGEFANALGILFVDVIRPRERATPHWPEGHVTCRPPVCPAHAGSAFGLGPHIAPADIVAMRVRSPRWHGLLGTPFQPGPGGAVPRPAPTPGGRGEMVITFDDPQRRLFLGSLLAISLHDVAVVDLPGEIAAAPLA